MSNAPTIDWKARALAAEACADALAGAAVPLFVFQPGTASWDSMWPMRRQHLQNAVDRWHQLQADYDTLDQAQADAARSNP